ncbi:TonB-dependent receptor plug domain-containing protein [Nostoc sp. CALU 546]|uniref:TonB-dependent receptor plug domain-containing protein n=1 Tax=Nostoc sp. CALU 546 TaxID=1867241 RepID=UPI003B675509
MQTDLILFNSVLLSSIFVSTAAAAPAQPTPESEIPYISEIQLPQTSAQFLFQNTNASSTSVAQTPTSPAEESEEPDIELDVIGTPLVNFIEERQNSPTGVIILDQKEIQRFNYRTIGEVLRRQPGVVLGGPPGEDKDVRLLGLPKEYSLG